jgi:putative phage-type endonuclease
MALTPEQIAIRKVGGSDVATILGLNPFETALELYHEKRGTIEPIDLSENLPVKAGNALEDAIAELAADALSRRWGKTVKLRRSNLTIVHPKYDWLTIHLDRDVVGEDRLVELKNVGYHAARNWGAADTDQIPEYYLPQVHTYLLVKNYPAATVAAFFGGADLRLYEIVRSKLWDELIIESTHHFWHHHVLAGVPPPLPEEIPVATAQRIARRLYPGTDGSIVPASQTQENLLQGYWEASAKAAAATKAADGLKAMMVLEMGNGAALVFSDGTRLERKLGKRKPMPAWEGIVARFKRPKVIEGEAEEE